MTVKRLTFPEASPSKQEEIDFYCKFVESLPDDSYLKLMFEGTESEVTQQILNDFGMNWMKRINEFYEEVEKKRDQAVELQRKLHAQEETAAATLQALENRFASREQQLIKDKEYCMESLKEARVATTTMYEQLTAKTEEARKAQATVEAKDLEIIKLKAKLYDLQNREG